MRSNHCGIVMLALSACIWAAPASAYDRDEVRYYARTYTDNSGKMSDGTYNSTIYYIYTYDCANFGSQCLNAGGIRFRCDGASNTSPTRKNEKETGKETRAIRNAGADTTKYSRVISVAQWLYESATHQRHGATDYNTNAQKADNGAAWNDVAIGDLAMHITGGAGGHTMVITDVVSGTPKDVKYCAHSTWRLDKPLLEAVPGWKTDQEYHLVCFPDAPRIKKCYLDSTDTYDTSKEVGWLWDKRKCSGYDALPKNAGKTVGLWITITFDCNMKTSEAATVKLLIDGTTPITFSPGTGGTWTNGWATGGSAGRFVTNRTWAGFISASSLPDGKNVVAKISVSAKGADGSGNDADNALDKYSAGACEAVNLQLDTRKAEGGEKQ